MKKVTLLGCTHRNDPNLPSRLMDDYGDALFAREILPHVTDETVIVAEGAYFKGIHTPSHPLYKTSLGDICPSLAQSGKKPRIIYNDYLFEISTVKRAKQMSQVGDFAQYCTNNISIDLSLIPSKASDFLPVLEQDDLYIIKRKPSQSIAQLARTAAVVNKRRTAAFVKAIERAVKLSEHVLVITGLSHSIDIHQKHGFPIKFLANDRNPSIPAAALFWAALVHNRFPQSVIEAAK